MKRFLVLLLILTITVAALCGTVAVASAAQNDVVISLDVTKEGDEVVATAYLEQNDGVVDLYLRVEYDTDSLELKERKFGTALSSLGPVDNFEEGGYEYPYRVTYTGNGTNSLDTGTLFTLRFRVKEGAKDGDSRISLVVRQVGYLAGDLTPDPIYNAKYGEPLEISDVESTKQGGITVSVGKVVIAKGTVTKVTSPGEPESDGSKGLMIGLIVAGVVILVGAVTAAFLVNRRKRQRSEK